MAEDPFAAHAFLPNAPARSAFAITPNDSADLPAAIRQLTIGTTGGVVVYDNPRGVQRTTGPLPVGTYAMTAHRIWATGTTAVGLTGWV